MKRFFVLLIFTLSVHISFSQDTIVVQTFTYDSIVTRRAIFDFPDELNSLEFEKVLMYYNLKCDPLTTWDSYNCGEWDYLVYSQIWQHTGDFDSVAVNREKYSINGATPSTIEYVDAPYYHYYQNYQHFITYTSETDIDHTIGNGTELSTAPFGASNNVQHTQILWTSDELANASITAGEIAKIRFDIETTGSSMGHLTIKMKHTSATEITGFDFNTGWTTVYDKNTNFSSAGIQTIALTYPFLYDGSSSILLDISFDNFSSTGIDNTVLSTNTSSSTVVFRNEKNGYLDVDAGEFVDVNLTDYNFGNEVTIQFWSNGNADFLPANTSIIEGYDSLNNRLMNVHFPWSNSSIYWDAGEGSGYDRIDKPAGVSDFEGQWHHWTFTKNATAGTMKIYRDGVLWHSGTSKNLEAGIINKFRIGNSLGGNFFWSGKIDEFAIWNTELSETEINDWLFSEINASHPQYGDLVVHYNFDDTHFVVDQSTNNFDGMMNGENMIQSPSNAPTDFQLSTIRPNITFVQGTYTSSVDSAMVVDSILVNPATIFEYQVNGRKFTIANVMHKYPAGYSYTYDHNGIKIDSVFIDADVTLNNETITYYEAPFEIIIPFEIGRYITPYGIGFDLGPNGFTYVYDVTDYQSLLLGDVDFSAHNTQELIDIKFVFITGTPPRDVLSVEQLWNGLQSYSYANLDNDVNLSSTAVSLNPEGDMFKLKTRITGHGHNGSNNCCEWGNGQGREHEILINGTSRFVWEIWQETECGDNPNIGQGGTWPYAREGWCPGDKVTDYEFDITPFVAPGTTVNIDYDIEDVPVSDPAQGNGNYVMSMHLVTYGAPNFSLDAAIVDVINPNDWKYYSKYNPTCQNPRVILQNTGSTTLTSAEINVWVGEFGSNVITYQWAGSLEFLESTIIEIPVDANWWYDYNGENYFTARVYKTNGQFDEYANNNSYRTTFEPSVAITEPFYIWFKTNNKAIENDLFLYDQEGNVVFSRTDLINTTEYKDTLQLEPGCYTLEITDTDHDGISFWYSNQVEGETAGFLRVRKVSGGNIYLFDPDFGRFSRFTFSIGYALETPDATAITPIFNLYPNPNKGEFNIVLDHFTGDKIDIVVYNEMGQQVYSETISDNNPEGYWEKNLSLENLTSGIYFVQIISDDYVATEKIVIEK